MSGIALNKYVLHKVCVCVCVCVFCLCNITPTAKTEWKKVTTFRSTLGLAFD